MHKGGGVAVKKQQPNASAGILMVPTSILDGMQTAKFDGGNASNTNYEANTGQQTTMKISSATKQKPTKVVDNSRRKDSSVTRRSPSKNQYDTLITPVLSKVVTNSNPSPSKNSPGRGESALSN